MTRYALILLMLSVVFGATLLFAPTPLIASAARLAYAACMVLLAVHISTHALPSPRQRRLRRIGPRSLPQ